MDILVADSVRGKVESLEQTVTTTRNAVAEVIRVILILILMIMIMMMIKVISLLITIMIMIMMILNHQTNSFLF